MDKGKLYIVSTPIGNMSDITLRAIDILGNVDLILSEDTRETDKILRHHNINGSQLSYRDQNHSKVFPKILETLELGKDVALVSDSGTPLISDPGFKLVSSLIDAGIDIVSIPGPSAVISALSVSGLPTDKFSFLGFLPKSRGQQEKILTEFGALSSTLVIYESPYRVVKLLELIREVLGNRKVCVVKDLTKMYEKLIYGEINDILSGQDDIKPKGEYVVLVAKEGF